LEIEEEITPEELGPAITKAEFEKALNELKSKQSYGVDNIPAELMEALEEETKLTLYYLIKNIYTTGKIPDDFKKKVMVMLSKKSNSTKFEEY
jgi:tRNA G26 N,N-dimethylase Trm1